MSYDSIRKVLDDRLKTAVGLLDVRYTNTEMGDSPDADESYILQSFVPTRRFPANRGPSPTHRYEGLYYLLVCTPLGDGDGLLLREVDKVVERFPDAASYSYSGRSVTVERTEAVRPYSDELHRCCPVIVNWFSYV